MRFNDYITEGTYNDAIGPSSRRTYKYYGYKKPRSEDVASDQAKDVIRNNCKDILKLYRKTKSRIYRGVNESADFRITDPSVGNRASAYADYNYYTLFLNNDPSWSEYPKREIICTTDSSKADEYTDKSLYLVFPYDGSKWGICPKSDIFTSFNIYSMSAFNRIMEFIVEQAGYKRSLKSWTSFKRVLKEADKSTIQSVVRDCNERGELEDILKSWNDTTYKTLYDFLSESFLDPKKNKFVLMAKLTKLPVNREIWTDSKCVLVNKRVLADVLENA